MNSLYCFLASEGLIFLKRGYLPFLTISQLAEPWLHGDARYKATAESEVSAQEFTAHLQQQYENLAPHLKQMLSFDYFLQQSQAKRSEIEKVIIKSKQPSVGQAFSLARLESWRCLALFTDWQRLNLWQSTGGEGKGLVLELDPGKSGFQHNSYNQKAQHLGKINSVANWLPQDDLYYLFNYPQSYGSEADQWRLIRQLQAADRKIEVQGQERAMYRLESKGIKRIILGYRCSEEYCLQVKRYLSQDINFRHVECVQAQLDPNTLCLQQVVIN